MFAAMADVAWDEAMMRGGDEACQDTPCPTPLSRPLLATSSPAVIFLPDSSNRYIWEQQGQYIFLWKAEVQKEASYVIVGVLGPSPRRAGQGARALVSEGLPGLSSLPPCLANRQSVSKLKMLLPQGARSQIPERTPSPRHK